MPEKIRFYGLSTCIHCKHTMQFLDSNNVDYECALVDLLIGDERRHAMDIVKEINPECSFPTTQIGCKVVVGFDPDALRQALDNV